MSAAEDVRLVAVVDRLQLAAVSLTTALIALIASWLLLAELSPARALLATVVTLPLWIALPRLHTGHRRTYAWMTLAVVPYLAFAMTEAIANPPARAWAAACLLLCLALFVLLIGYLRIAKGPAGD